MTNPFAVVPLASYCTDFKQIPCAASWRLDIMFAAPVFVFDIFWQICKFNATEALRIINGGIFQSTT